MKFTLEENAADSLRRSVAYFIENTPTGLKAAVKEIVSAVELYVKLQLVHADCDPSHPVLVYERFRVRVSGSPPGYDLEPEGTATVSFAQALERLKWLGHGIPTVDVAQINTLKRLRNALEHHSAIRNSEDVRKMYAAVAAFTIRYLHTRLHLAFLELVDGDDWREALRLEPELRHLAELSAKQVYGGLVAAEERAAGTATCVQCGADCMIPHESYYGGFRCVVCGFVHDVEMCYGCREEFFVGLLTPAEGDTLLCSACHKRVYGAG